MTNNTMIYHPNPSRDTIDLQQALVNPEKAIPTNDEYLQTSTNSLIVYNNGGQAVTMTRKTHLEAMVTSPNRYGWVLEFRANTSLDKKIAPNHGGFYPPNLKSFPNGCLVEKFVAKLPVGYSFIQNTNAVGTHYSFHWVGGPDKCKGTGKWTQYMGVRVFGDQGDFSNTGHISVKQDDGGSSTETLMWHLSSYICWYV
jgi:hypothetical protein